MSSNLGSIEARLSRLDAVFARRSRFSYYSSTTQLRMNHIAGNVGVHDCGIAFLPAPNAINMENINAIHDQTIITDRLA
jgi:hypothetical protein